VAKVETKRKKEGGSRRPIIETAGALPGDGAPQALGLVAGERGLNDDAGLLGPIIAPTAIGAENGRFNVERKHKNGRRVTAFSMEVAARAVTGKLWKAGVTRGPATTGRCS